MVLGAGIHLRAEGPCNTPPVCNWKVCGTRTHAHLVWGPKPMHTWYGDQNYAHLVWGPEPMYTWYGGQNLCTPGMWTRTYASLVWGPQRIRTWFGDQNVYSPGMGTRTYYGNPTCKTRLGACMKLLYYKRFPRDYFKISVASINLCGY